MAALRDDPAVVDDQDLVGEPLGLVHEVGGQHDGDALAASSLTSSHTREPGLGVEPGARLVEEDDLGPAHDGAGEGEPLALAAGEARGRRCREVG